MRSFALVALGGAAGTLARHGMSTWLADEHLFPTGTFVVNVSGSFVLGALLAWLAVRDDTTTRRDLRLLAGTGFLGGYTTYSALAVETQSLWRDGHAALGLTYALGSVVAGLVTAGAGIAVARKTVQ